MSIENGESPRDYSGLRVTPSWHHLEVLVTVVASPVQGKVGSLEELFMRVFPRDV